jgi:type IV secretory pathway TrbF-like protein
MPHIFTDAEYARTDMLYVYGFCDGSATAAIEEYRRRFPVCRIPDRRVFSKMSNTLRESDTLPGAHISSERAHK